MAAKLESQKTAPMGALPYSETAASLKMMILVNVEQCTKNI